jgi:integrase
VNLEVFFTPTMGSKGPPPTVTVAALMGHASIATTQIYTQPGEADMIRAVEKLG